MILVGDFVPQSLSVADPGFRGRVLCNLEAPVLGDGKYPKSVKSGPHIFNSALPEFCRGWVFTLANNHMMDYGASGLGATKAALAECGAQSCGAGANLAEARFPLIIDEGGVRVAIIACCEPQFGDAQTDVAGVAVAGGWVVSEIIRLRRENLCEHVVVSCHAGLEFSPWPSPEIRELYRSYIDAGASIVHGHHAHIPQGYEKYKRGFIAYGLGNFVADPSDWSWLKWSSLSLGLEVDFSPSTFNVTPFTLTFTREQERLHVIKSKINAETDIGRYFDGCCAPFDDSRLMLAVWQEAAIRTYGHLYAERLKLPGGGANIYRIRPLLRVCVEVLNSLSMVLLRRPLFRRRMVESMLYQKNAIRNWSHAAAIDEAISVGVGLRSDIRSTQSRLLADYMMSF